ncbi:hypothetical protein [Acinetobacter haemolyticus]|uniref:hypothetical protein n=1 Tax=Acinetobacter haemolyticus TaxID=29430 RepID=UPI0034CF1D3E
MINYTTSLKINRFLDSLAVMAINLTLFGLYSVTVAAYSNTPLQETYKEYIVGDWLMAHPFIVVFTGIGAALLYKIFYLYVKRKANSNRFHKHKIATALLVAIDRAVTAKRQRFADAVNTFLRLKTSKYTTNRVFNNITQPQEQIKTLIEALDTFFRSSYDIQFKIGLMRIDKNESIEDWELYYPAYDQPKTSLDDLRKSTSTISQCIQHKELKIVSDVKKEIQKQKKKKQNHVRLYEKGATSESESWSQLCYPIRSISTKRVIYVVTIAAKDKGFFKENERDDYKWILDHIGNRLAIEHSLKELKQGSVL